MERYAFSGYTRKNNKGIHIYDIDFFNNEYNRVDFIAEESPTFLSFNGDRSRMMSISAKSIDDGKKGGVSLYKINSNGKYELVDEYLEMASSPCHLFYDESRKLLFSSNYHLGQLDIFVVESDKLEHQGIIKFNGKGIVSPDQDSSRVHMSILDSYNKNLLLCDLGDDRVYTIDIFEVDPEKYSKINLENDFSANNNVELLFGEKSKYNARILSSYKTNSGFGPRHITYGSNKDIFYLIGELSSEIDVLKYDDQTGEFTKVSSISSIPLEVVKDGVNNTAAAIKVSSDGRYLYASNRGYDVITVFDIEPDGNIKYNSYCETGYKTPRDFGFSKDESYVLVGHQNSDYVTVLKRNQSDGSLTKEQIEINLSEIVYVGLM